MTNNEVDLRRTLRNRAEALISTVDQVASNPPPEEIRRLAHDLAVHQVELEMQNEELQATHLRMDAALARYAKLYHRAPVGFLTLDINGFILQWNQTFQDMLGPKKWDLAGTSLADLFESPEREIFLARYRAIFRMPEGKHLDARLKQESGTFLDIRLTSRFESDDITSVPEGPMGRHLLVAVHDITDEKRAERVLREVLENSADASYKRNLKTNAYEYLSPVFQQISGYPSDEIMGMSIESVLGLVHSEDLPGLQRAVSESMHSPVGNTNRVEYRFKHKDGHYVWLRDKYLVLRNPAEGPEAITGSVSDISWQKAAEEEKAILQSQLQQAHKLESLGVLAGGVAHDMNNVLGAILGLASANLSTHSEGTRDHHAYKTIMQACERGGKMVKGLLGFARKSPAEDRELNINTILQEEARLLERTTLAKVRVEMDLAADLRPMRGDAGALAHAVMNLCVNAVDAMPDQGMLTLKTRNVDNGWIEILLADTGSGMSKEIIEKAIDPFFTTKEAGKGTGLGLSMVHSTVRAHRGQMEILSQPGQGTQVRIRFPASEHFTISSDTEHNLPVKMASGALTVLLVDDDELIQTAMEVILEALGHAVGMVPSGEEALLRLGSGFTPDVVMLDMNMPGLGGTGTLPRLRALNPTVPVLLMTGRADQFALDLVEAFPFVTLLSKPFSMNELQHCLEHIRPR
jgi:PAS domain S-box-containing protein